MKTRKLIKAQLELSATIVGPGEAKAIVLMLGRSAVWLNEEPETLDKDWGRAKRSAAETFRSRSVDVTMKATCEKAAENWLVSG